MHSSLGRIFSFFTNHARSSPEEPSNLLKSRKEALRRSEREREREGSKKGNGANNVCAKPNSGLPNWPVRSLGYVAPFLVIPEKEKERERKRENRSRGCRAGPLKKGVGRRKRKRRRRLEIARLEREAWQKRQKRREIRRGGMLAYLLPRGSRGNRTKRALKRRRERERKREKRRRRRVRGIGANTHFVGKFFSFSSFQFFNFSFSFPLFRAMEKVK